MSDLSSRLANLKEDSDRLNERLVLLLKDLESPDLDDDRRQELLAHYKTCLNGLEETIFNLEGNIRKTL